MLFFLEYPAISEFMRVVFARFVLQLQNNLNLQQKKT